VLAKTLFGLSILVAAGPSMAAEAVILCYHRFGPTVADGMTTRTATFEQQIARLRADGWQFVPLDAVIEGLRGRRPLPEKAVAITIDDGHATVYTEVLPIVRRESLPVTLFIYPSAIGNAKYAMTWEQLQALKDTGYFSIEAHTYWHPNFKTEKKRLDPAAYAKLVKLQLEKPRQVLARRLGVQADVLAWPFGIHDAELEAAAAAAGYRAALALDERPATNADSPFALPRFLIVDASGVNGLSRLIQSRSAKQP
jgi:peptidoglycan/xylan/chitin deacetylase (PgdA/CDA1 family)